MKHYTVDYYENGSYEDVKTECVLANNKADAYKVFMDSKNWAVYGAWVSGVTYQNGNYRTFNTFCGNPY